MNKRILSIIYELCRADSRISIGGLAEKYKVSQRTIRNDLNTVNRLLRENSLNELQLKSGGIVCREDDFEKILPFISDRDFYTYKLSKEERVKVAVSLLVNSAGYITLSAITDSLFVSRATVINDNSFIFRKIPLSQIAGAFEMFKTPGAVKGKILIDSEH